MDRIDAGRVVCGYVAVVRTPRLVVGCIGWVVAVGVAVANAGPVYESRSRPE